ncbi:ribonuclease P protein component [Helicobacter cetorum]|uniref:ribonuclease P protein component n=1 Tax=Helicobacter cetorum TaxID=138563 RepID=UPI000CF0E735|nr:ribonuclease P protein component [Helicobacter cetorum]
MLDALKAEKSFLFKPVGSLKTKSEFDKVYKKGLKRHTPFFSLHAISLQAFSMPRLAQHTKSSLSQGQIYQGQSADFMTPSCDKISLGYNKRDSCLSLLGLSVSKKVGNAIKRNLIKRRLRSLVTKHIKLCKGLALVFVPRSGIQDLDFKSLENHFLETLTSLQTIARSAKKGVLNSSNTNSKRQAQAHKASMDLTKGIANTHAKS